MNLHWVDWTIVLVFLLALIAIAIYVKQYTKTVAGFLVANRCAGRYLLTMADGMAAMGAISIVAEWQKYYQASISRCDQRR